jgi:hypothetical protein
MRRLMPGVMRLVMRLGLGMVRLRMVRPWFGGMRLWVVWLRMVRLGVRPLMLGLGVRLVGRMVMRRRWRRRGNGFCLPRNKNRGGRSHAQQGGHAKEEGAAAHLWRLGRGTHKASPKG